MGKDLEKTQKANDENNLNFVFSCLHADVLVTSIKVILSVHLFLGCQLLIFIYYCAGKQQTIVFLMRYYGDILMHSRRKPPMSFAMVDAIYINQRIVPETSIILYIFRLICLFLHTDTQVNNAVYIITSVGCGRGQGKLTASCAHYPASVLNLENSSKVKVDRPTNRQSD